MIARAYSLLVDAFDVGGRDGRLSFSKAILIAVLVLGTFWKLPVVLGIACIAASFGVKTFVAFLNRSHFSASAKTDVSIDVTKILARRDAAEGIEETP